VKKFTVGILVALLAVSLVLSGCSQPSQPSTTEPKYKIGLVFDIGGRGDHSFNDSAYNGLVRLQKSSKVTSKTTQTMLTTDRGGA